jgi:hypothetical protein
MALPSGYSAHDIPEHLARLAYGDGWGDDDLAEDIRRLAPVR